MILKFLQFIKEELTKLPSYSSKSGATKLSHLIYNDENPDPKSQASGLLLRNKLKEEEIESIINILGKDIPPHYLNDPKYLKLLVAFNNLKFLKDSLRESGELRCEYCNDGPLVIYDFTKNGDNVREFLDNPKYKMNVKFDPKDGATCDHKVPQSKGGDRFDYNNLAVCCFDCNQRKKDMDYDVWMDKVVNRQKGRK